MVKQFSCTIAGIMVATCLGMARAEKTAPAPAKDDSEELSRQDNSDSDASKLQAADQAMERLINADDWREARAAKEQLAALGDAAADIVRRYAEKGEKQETRLHCYEILTEHFGDDEWTVETIAEDGLSDQSADIRYHCAWHCGELKIYGAHRRLRRLMEDAEQTEHIRYAAAKSLAELGEPSVIVKLLEGMQHDRFMPRHMANIGAKALAGKCLNDFGDYDYAEGAFVSGGNEAMMMHPHPVEVHAKIARRHQAIANFCLWLEKERPEIFKYLYAPY